MPSLALIIGVGWIGFWLYWIISAFSSKKGSLPLVKQFVGIRLAMIGLTAVLVLSGNHLPESTRQHFLGTSWIVLAVGLILFCLGMGLAIWARIYLGKNWGMPMTVKQDPELVTDGPYRYIRHPIYTGVLLMAAGSAVDVNIYWLLVFIVAGVFFVYSAFAEEKLMTKQFPKAYPPYKRKTKMLIPFIL